ncbi:MAG: PQ loop repeat protein [Firmicutes bacterium ADurb.Bin080]|nr:MAG: PQ loop repeat protein [Firmicutes bacterium ADurb.Bin080]
MLVKMTMEFVGIIGTLIICMSILPQVIKVYKTKSARDLSIAYLSALMTGLVLLIIYSFYVGNLVFIFGNVLSLLSVLMLIILRKKYSQNGLARIIHLEVIQGKEVLPCHKPQLSQK